MATGGDFKILISDEANTVGVYVNQSTTVKEIKAKFLVEAKNVEKERSTFHLLKDNCSLDDDATVRSSKITKGDVLIKANEERKKLITRTVAKVQSPYGAGLNKKKNIAPLVKPKRRTKSEPPHPSTAKETIPTDQKDEHREIKQQNQFANRKTASSSTLLRRNVKTAPMEQRKVMTTLQRPDTAPAFIKAEDFEKHRPLSTMTTRSSSTNNLSALVTDLLCHDAMEKAVEYRLSSSSAETLKLSEALTPFVGDLNAAVQNAELLSAELLQEGLITNALHRDMINTMGLLNSLKTTKLIDSVRVQLKTSPRPIEALKSFFKAISYDPALTTFITKIEQHIGFSVTAIHQTPNVRRMLISARSRCKKCVISENDIASIVCRTAPDVKLKWFLLGTVLNLQTEELMEIKRSHSDPGNLYAEMMHVWIHSSSNRFPPTWQILTTYLMRPLELEGLATELRKEYCYTCCYSYIRY